MVTAMREHANKVMTQVQSDGAARSELVASWHRCMLRHRLDPAAPTGPRRLSAQELSLARHGTGPLVDSFQQGLRDLKKVFGGQSACSLVTGADGIVLDASGHGTDPERLDHLGLSPGFDWSEEQSGTNGVGTCLVSERPVSIRHDEHFFLPEDPMACVAAPIFGPEGHLAGALNLSLLSRAAEDAFATRALLHLAISVARDIEKACFVKAHPGCRIVTAENPSGPGLSLLAIDGDDVIVGATRAVRTGREIDAPALARGIPASDLFEPCDSDGFARAERAVLRRTLLRTQGNVTAAAELLDISRATMKRKVGKHFAPTGRATPKPGTAAPGPRLN
ncbi:MULTISPECIES: GAF domain-containing protein [Marinovum]|uniref:GAF domain-containing protein n=1 Tax=Marinovum TaxID=367771 RepID=UPI00237C2E3B|nr:GAF domain-containing protein [Marinovum sp. PR37]MDD9746812.1 GAF domain-containing protein [Marinovum sp. PR37]